MLALAIGAVVGVALPFVTHAVGAHSAAAGPHHRSRTRRDRTGERGWEGPARGPTLAPGDYSSARPQSSTTRQPSGSGIVMLRPSQYGFSGWTSR